MYAHQTSFYGEYNRTQALRNRPYWWEGSHWMAKTIVAAIALIILPIYFLAAFSFLGLIMAISMAVIVLGVVGSRRERR